MLPEAFLKGLHEFLHHFQQNIGRRAIAFLPDLINRFLGADAHVCHEIVHGAVSSGVPGLDVAGSLPGQVIAVALLIKIPLDLVEGRILPGLIGLVISKAVLPIPIEVQACPAFVDVVRMVYVELPVIVFGVIDAVLSRTAIVTGHPLFGFGHGVTSVSLDFVTILFLCEVAFVPRHLRFSTGNTQYEVSMLNTSLGQRLRLWTLSKGLSLASRAGAAALHPPQGISSLDPEQGSSPCNPPTATKKRYRIDTAFLWISAV